MNIIPDGIVVGAIVLVIGGAIAYIIRAKRKGEKCIGCPYSKTCNAGKQGGCKVK